MTDITLADLTFDYAIIPDDQARAIAQTVAADIKPRLRRTAEDIFAIGKGLLRAKDALPHGYFGRWAYDELGLTSRTAQRFMQVAERLGNESDNLSHLLPSVLYQLAGDNTPPETVNAVIKLARAGERVTVAQAREIVRRASPTPPPAGDSTIRVPLRMAGDSQPAPSQRTSDSMAGATGTGTCRACHRPLTDPASVAAGIGICCARREQMTGGSDGAAEETDDAITLTDDLPVYGLSDDDVITHRPALTPIQRSSVRNLLRTIGYGVSYFQPHPAAREFGIEEEWLTAWDAIQTLVQRMEEIAQ
jgi:hypothetical protein